MHTSFLLCPFPLSPLHIPLLLSFLNSFVFLTSPSFPTHLFSPLHSFLFALFLSSVLDPPLHLFSFFLYPFSYHLHIYCAPRSFSDLPSLNLSISLFYSLLLTFTHLYPSRIKFTFSLSFLLSIIISLSLLLFSSLLSFSSSLLFSFSLVYLLFFSFPPFFIFFSSSRKFVSFCAVLYCTVLYCTVLFCSVLFSSL